jgi:hypothetical protein
VSKRPKIKATVLTADGWHPCSPCASPGWKTALKKVSQGRDATLRLSGYTGAGAVNVCTSHAAMLIGERRTTRLLKTKKENA